ncbi:chromatin modification-related protein eaf-1 [Tetranychus urticae]|uniref:Uncharacterized protein n=1 Tax=Tetranychus urticae TaxID=32264 RepID=T1KU18_TETUR|nr:chromatin modification-related protein eaf-1 [Tetranychus urticae]
MFFTKIICTLLLIQSFQLAIAQDEDYLGPVESLPRFEARRQSSLNAKEDFEYDDDNSASSRGKTNPLPARTGRNDDNNEDDFDENQAPQNENSGSLSPVNVGPSGTKGQSVSSSGRLGLPRFPSKQDNTFIAPLPAPPRPVAIPAPVAPITVVGKTNLGSSGSLGGDRFFPLRSNDGTKTVRVVKTARVVRPGPVAVDQSEASLANLNGGVKSSQIRPSVTRVVGPVLVQQRPTFVTPVQPVAPSPLPVSIATPISSGSAGPNQIVSGGVKTVQVSGNSNLQPPRLRVISNQRPVAPAVDEDDEDDSASASSGPSRGQLSGVKTVVTNQFAGLSSGRLAPVPRFNPTRTLVQPIRQPAQVIYADQKLTSQDEDDFDGNNGNAVDLSQPDLVKINRPTQVPVRIAPQPYLVPLPSRSFRPESSADISPAVSNGKVNTIKSTFVARPQPVPARQTIFTQVAPTPFQPPIAVSSGSASGSQSVSAIKGSGSIAPSRFQPRLPTVQRITPTVNFVDEDGTASNPSGARPVLIRTTGPSPVRPVFQTNVQEKINTGSQSVASVQPVLRFNPQPQPQQIVQIRDSGALPAELSLPSPPRPVQIVQQVRNTPAPTIRPVTQVTQVRESAVSDFQTVQISQPRLVPVAPSPQPQIRVFEPRPLTQVSQVSQFEDSGLNVFQPLDPSLRPSIPQASAQGQLSQDRESVAPREVFIRQPAQPQVQVSQVSQVSQVRQVQPSVETVQIRETAVPITSQGNLGVQQISQPRPVDDFQPAPQPFEILRLREPSFPRFSFDQARPQPVVSVRPRLVPATLPESRPVVQISQEKEASLAQQQAVQAQVNIIQQQQQQQQLQQQREQQQREQQQLQQQRQQEQREQQLIQQQRQQQQQQLQQRQQEQREQLQQRQQQQQQQLQQIQQQQQQRQQQQQAQQQQQQQLQQVKEILNEERRVQIPVAPVAPLVNIESFKTVSQPRPVFRQPVVPRLVAPLPLQPFNQVSSGSQSSGFPGPVQNRFETVQISQPAPVVTVQQPRPTLVVNRPQPAQVIVSNRQPVATVQVQDNSQSADVQVRDAFASIASDYSQIQQVKLARA